jgi:hypothetical protein
MEGLVWALVPIAAILGGITLAIVKTRSMARVRELEVRERIAMIEKGLIPSPEVNPRGFEQAMSAMGRAEEVRDWTSDFNSRWERFHYRRAERHRGAGITLVGIGLGMMLMLGFAAGEPERGVGIGGFLVLLGIAFFINSVFERRDRARPDPPPFSSASTSDRPPQS